MTDEATPGGPGPGAPGNETGDQEHPGATTATATTRAGGPATALSLLRERPVVVTAVGFGLGLAGALLLRARRAGRDTSTADEQAPATTTAPARPAGAAAPPAGPVAPHASTAPPARTPSATIGADAAPPGRRRSPVAPKAVSLPDGEARGGPAGRTNPIRAGTGATPVPPRPAAGAGKDAVGTPGAAGAGKDAVGTPGAAEADRATSQGPRPVAPHTTRASEHETTAPDPTPTGSEPAGARGTAGGREQMARPVPAGRSEPAGARPSAGRQQGSGAPATSEDTRPSSMVIGGGDDYRAEGLRDLAHGMSRSGEHDFAKVAVDQAKRLERLAGQAGIEPGAEPGTEQE